MTNNRQNWSGHVPYGATHYHSPHSIDQLQSIVAAANKMRVVGARHSFNEIHDCPEAIISLDNLDKTVTIDHERHTAGGKLHALQVRYNKLGFLVPLHQRLIFTKVGLVLVLA